MHCVQQVKALDHLTRTIESTSHRLCIWGRKGDMPMCASIKSVLRILDRTIWACLNPSGDLSATRGRNATCNVSLCLTCLYWRSNRTWWPTKTLSYHILLATALHAQIHIIPYSCFHFAKMLYLSFFTKRPCAHIIIQANIGYSINLYTSSATLSEIPPHAPGSMNNFHWFFAGSKFFSGILNNAARCRSWVFHLQAVNLVSHIKKIFLNLRIKH